MPGISLQPNEVSFNAAISACEPLGYWEQAVYLLVHLAKSKDPFRIQGLGALCPEHVDPHYGN